MAHDYKNLYQAFLDGGSVVINHCDKVWPGVAALCQQLTPIFGHVYANMYLTPAGSQAVPPHSDDRDVFIIQLEGSKHWKVYHSPIELPYKDEQVGKDQRHITRDELPAASIDEVLEAGDVLYMPRGFVHEAFTSDATSLHVTLAIPTADFAWGHFLAEASS